jgi:diadenosine tetraphosphate (Ap4A) HIT family hydrolase
MSGPRRLWSPDPLQIGGEHASQSIPYLHFHLIPRTEHDRLWEQGRSLIPYDRSSGFERMHPSPEELEELSEALRSRVAVFQGTAGQKTSAPHLRHSDPLRP